MVLRLDEHYVSVQGEGPRVGLPTQFIRFGGCNLRCPGWPCDTQHAIDPAFRKEWKVTRWTDILETALDLQDKTGASNICLTGGEPFLQGKGDLEALFMGLIGEDFSVECFSNGTLPYPEWARGIKFVMDWKLTGSGEDHVGVPQRLENIALLNGSGLDQAVKFVLKDERDLDEAKITWEVLTDKYQWNNIQFFYGRVWDAKWTDADMIEAVLMRRLPWRLNMQVHNYIWDRSLRGI